jgi:hypothetical protein
MVFVEKLPKNGRFLGNTSVMDSERDSTNIMCRDEKGEEERIFIMTTNYYKDWNAFLPLLNFTNI